MKAGKAFGVVSASDLHGIRVALILILFWVGVWNLTETAISWIEEKYQIHRTKLYIGLVLLILLLIILDPMTFEKAVN
jgi:low temperature requirement protein LtrA